MNRVVAAFWNPIVAKEYRSRMRTWKSPLAMMIYIERNIAPHLIASAQGLYAPAWSAALAVATLGSGPLWRMYGVHAYNAMALIAAAGALIAFLAMREHVAATPLPSATAH